MMAKITRSDFDAWMTKQPESALLIHLQDLNQSRHDDAHADIRSADDQNKFLTKLDGED